ncbi:MAG: VOC family protein [Ignavibacteria bacterium]
MKIPDNTLIQSISLRVRNIEDSVKFYSYLMGFKVIDKKPNQVFLSPNGKLPYLICLTESGNSKSRNPKSPGLFHAAFKFPSRKELGRVFLRLFNNQIKFQGFSDHLVSEAIYLSDPDGNGIELYADKPRSEWEWTFGQVVMDTLPLDLSKITSEIDDPEIWNGIHPETNIGHIHLSVSDLYKSEKFYSHILGFNVSNSLIPGAVFYSAGGYHHHIGTNIWQSEKGRTYEEKKTGLLEFTIKFPDENYLRSVTDKITESDLYIKSEGLNEFKVKDSDGIEIRLIV